MEHIILEDSKGKIRRNKEEKDEGIIAKIEKERKTMQLTAGVCSPVLVSLFFSRLRSLLFVAISSREIIPALTRFLLCSFARPAEWWTRVALFGCDKRGST